MITYGQWFCDVKVQVSAFSACYTYADTINTLLAMLGGLALVIVLIVVLWGLQTAWLRYVLNKRNRTIAAMAMAQGES